MKRVSFKVTAFLLTIVVLVTVVPVKEVNAATQDELWNKYMTEALDDLFSHVGNKYFTVNEKNCSESNHGGCSNCNVENVIKANWFKRCFSDRNYVEAYNVSCFPQHWNQDSLGWGGKTCFGFAGFGQYYLYDYLSRKFLSTSVGNIYADGKLAAQGAFNATFCKANVKVGDILRLKSPKNPNPSHSVVVYQVLDNGIKVIDNNWFSDEGSSYTQMHTISYYNPSADTYSYVYVSRPTNTYTKLMNAISTSQSDASVANNVKTTAQGGRITITWDAVNNAQYYALYMKDTSGNVVLVHNRISTNTYSCEVRPEGQKLGFVVKAYANKVWGGYSKTSWVTVGSAVRPPSTITVTPGPSSAAVSWEAVPGAQVYALFMKDASGVVTLIHNRIVTNSYNVNGLTAGKSVGFVVKAYVSRQWSGWSGTTWTKPLEGTAKVFGVLSLEAGYSSYNVGLNVEMEADKAYSIKNGATLEILGKYTNSRGNEIYHVYSPDLGFECYVGAKYVKVN